MKKSINVIIQISRMEDKNHMIILMQKKCVIKFNILSW